MPTLSNSYKQHSIISEEVPAVLNQTNIECFLSLAETLSFSETASRVYMTQQAVSKSISRLENHLGFSLFVRSSRSVSLTNEGRRCYELFKSLEEQYNNTLKEIRDKNKNACVTLNIGYQDFLDLGPETGRAFSVLCKELPSLLLNGDRYPPHILRDRLLDRQLDMAVMFDRFYESLVINKNHFKRLELFKAQKLIMVSASNPNIKPDSTYKDFIHQPLLLDTLGNESTKESNRRAEKIIEQCGLKPQKVIILPNRDSAYMEAELGRGIVISSKVNLYAKTKTLKMFPIDGYETIICLWHDDGENSLSEKFAGILQREFLKRVENERRKKRVRE